MLLLCIYIVQCKNIKNIFFQLTVPTATIIGGPDIYVNYGSTINLTCTITHSTEPPPAYIFWYYSKEDDNTSTNSPSTKGPVRVSLTFLILNNFSFLNKY